MSAIQRGSDQPVPRETPKFTGVRTHRDPQGRFSVRFATDWAWFTIDEAVGLDGASRREGIGALPNPDDAASYLSMWVTPLTVAVTADDLADLRDGVEEGLESLQGCQVIDTEDIILDNLVKFVRVYSYRDGDSVRKRQQWLIYAHNLLLCLTWQGSSLAEYDYWYAMANHTFMTMELPPELWFATDRSLPSLGGDDGDEEREN